MDAQPFLWSTGWSACCFSSIFDSIPNFFFDVMWDDLPLQFHPYLPTSCKDGKTFAAAVCSAADQLHVVRTWLDHLLAVWLARNKWVNVKFWHTVLLHPFSLFIIGSFPSIEGGSLWSSFTRSGCEYQIVRHFGSRSDPSILIFVVPSPPKTPFYFIDNDLLSLWGHFNSLSLEMMRRCWVNVVSVVCV